MRAANEIVIMRADAAPLGSPTDQTGGDAVLGGNRESMAFILGRTTIAFRNVTFDDQSRWLSIKVA
jgi:hypothetical protein